MISEKTVILRVKTEKDVQSLEEFIAQRAYTIDGVTDVQIISAENGDSQPDLQKNVGS